MHYKSVVKQFNVLKRKPRYKRKRERRVSKIITPVIADIQQEIFNDAALHYADIKKAVSDYVEPEYITSTGNEGEGITIDLSEYFNEVPVPVKPNKLTWFDKLLLYIRKIFIKFTKGKK